LADLSALLSFNVTLFIQGFVLLFSLFDAIGTAPVFLALTENFEKERPRIVRQSILIATAILFIFAFLGLYIFQYLGITINDFRIAGGCVLFLIAIDNLRGRVSETRSIDALDIAAFPLATPLLAGPGAISTVIILSNPPYGPLVATLVILLNAVIAWAILRNASRVQKVLGTQGTRIFTRLMGLLIAAIGVAFVREGIVGIVQSMGV